MSLKDLISTYDLKAMDAFDASTRQHQEWEHQWYSVSRCESTNRIIADFGEAGIDEGVIVLAHEQTAGYGRQGAKWFSHPGVLEFSLLLRPTSVGRYTPYVNLIFSYAVLKTLASLYALPAMLKWPNDVIVSGRKICGVMSELKGEKNSFIVLGCGLNLNLLRSSFPNDIRSSATSVQAETHIESDLAEVLSEIVCNFVPLYERFCTVSHS